MKIIKLTSIIFIIMMTINTVSSAELTARQIIEKSEEISKVDTSWSIGEQTIITSGGSSRTFKIEMWTKDENEKQLMEYLTPARVKGVKFLFLEKGDEIYTYFPKTDRVRHLASHMKRQKMMGSDFSYEDMSFGELDTDFKSFKTLKTEKKENGSSYVVEMIPSDKGPHYSKMIMWVDTKTFVMTRIDYFEEGKLLKRLIASDIKTIQEIPTAMKIKMTNLQDGGETEMRTTEIKYHLDISDKIFTTRQLKKR